MPPVPTDPVDPPNWSFDVFTAKHDDMKNGQPYPKSRSRIVVSRQDFPSWQEAAGVAACMAMIRHGGMATDIYARY